MNIKKGKLNLLKNQKVIAVIGMLILILIAVPIINNLNRRFRINKELQELNKEINEAEKRNKDLNNLISYLESEQFIENQARTNFNLKKQGEEVVIIKGDNSIIKKNSENIYDIKTSAEQKIKNTSNPNKWWHYFFN